MKKSYFILYAFLLCTQLISAQLSLPYIFENKSRYTDEEIYVGLVGKTNDLGDVWMDMTSSELQRMSADQNTIPGPEWSSPADWLYPDIFTKLSDIDANTIQIPQGLFGCRIFISFESPMYLHFHETGGYAGANLANPGDPNDGIRWEIVELTWGDSGLWTNTSRVDAYQYPMGLEVDGFSGGVTGATYTDSYNAAVNRAGTPQFKKIGEILSHYEILDAWDRNVSAAYQVAKITKDNSIDGEPIIEQPSKVDAFPRDVLDTYIDDIWETYSTNDLNINIGDRGHWIGSVNSNDQFVFTDASTGNVGIIYGKPASVDAIEGAGFLAYTPFDGADPDERERYDDDLMIQAQMAAAISRHAIYTNITDNTIQYTHDASRFFVIEPYNEYVKFFHDEEISFESQTYAFAYDDVGDHSSTIQCTFPTEVKVIIGGYAEETLEPSVFSRIEITPETDTFVVNEPITFTAQAYDQYDRKLSTDVLWSVSNGNINADGIFTVTNAGSYTVTATQNDISEYLEFSVSEAEQIATCYGSPENGDFSYAVTNENSNPSITFIPTNAATGSETCIFYYRTESNAGFSGHSVNPNEAFAMNAASGSTVDFYYTYSLPSGGENNTSNDIQTFSVGTCSATLSNDDFEVFNFEKWLSISPNPTKGQNTYLKGLTKSVNVNIFNLQGSLISSYQAQGVEALELETSQLTAGLYLVSVSSLNNQFTKTFKVLVN